MGLDCDDSRSAEAMNLFGPLILGPKRPAVRCVGAHIWISRHRRLLGRRRRSAGRRRGSVSLHDSVWADSDGHSLWAATTTVFLFLSHG
jgi:hypothetical protein